MTVAHDPAESARLIAASRGDDALLSASDRLSTGDLKAAVSRVLSRDTDLADQLEAACAEVAGLTRSLQRESTWVNELNGVIAFVVGALHEVSRSRDLEAAKTCAEMGAQNIAEYHAGTWKPGPADDPADWRANR